MKSKKRKCCSGKTAYDLWIGGDEEKGIIP
jgi:hypothetical protein